MQLTITVASTALRFRFLLAFELGWKAPRSVVQTLEAQADRIEPCYEEKLNWRESYAKRSELRRDRLLW